MAETEEVVEMPLDTALSILARVHTSDDPYTGFVIRMVATPQDECSAHEYVEAWKAVRRHCHLADR